MQDNGEGTQPIEETNVNPSPEAPNTAPSADVNITPVSAESDPAPEPIVEAPVFKDEDFLTYAKTKYGKEFTSVDEIFAEKAPVEKIVDPWENVIDDEDKQYLNFKKETGRSRKDFESLNTDYAKVSALELAREKVRAEVGDNSISNELADRYIAKELNIDLDDPSDIDELDQLKLNGYAKSIRDQKIADKEKYRQPIAPKNPETQQGLVTLDNGTVMKKEAYEKLVNEHQTHIAKTKEAVNSVAESSFKVVFDDNGTPREENYKYEYSPEDKHSMVSIASDVSSVMEKRYRTEAGFNHRQFNEDMFWTDPTNREKAIASIVHKAIAKNTEDLSKLENNVDFNRNKLPQGAGNGAKIVSVGDLLSNQF